VIGALLAVAFAYSRLVARRAGASYALGVGIAWLALSIVVEITVSFHLGHAWFTLIGSPIGPCCASSHSSRGSSRRCFSRAGKRSDHARVLSVLLVAIVTAGGAALNLNPTTMGLISPSC
jgi:hypothetical protein